jgi:hypothetical protein
MMNMRRGEWDEIDLDDEPDTLMMFHPGWTNDRETLVVAIRETGWFPTTRQAFQAGEDAELKWGWVGITDESTLVICDSDGTAAKTGEEVSDVVQVTLARIGNTA